MGEVPISTGMWYSCTVYNLDTDEPLRKHFQLQRKNEIGTIYKSSLVPGYSTTEETPFLFVIRHEGVNEEITMRLYNITAPEVHEYDGHITSIATPLAWQDEADMWYDDGGPYECRIYHDPDNVKMPYYMTIA